MIGMVPLSALLAGSLFHGRPLLPAPQRGPLMSFSDELEELNACRCQATLPGELYAFLKGWLRWGSEPSPDISFDYDHEVRSRVRAGISIAHRFSRVGAAGSCLPWERAPSVVAALQEELGLGDEAILSHVVECPFILSLSWELHMRRRWSFFRHGCLSATTMPLLPVRQLEPGASQEGRPPRPRHSCPGQGTCTPA